jgi:16S rRNA (guanine527-N7)-methyltransferase
VCRWREKEESAPGQVSIESAWAGLSRYHVTTIERLVAAAATLEVPLSQEDAGRLLALLEELARWNRTYNLTAITDPQAMLTHHLLDSLAVHRHLQSEEGTGVQARVADVGTGAGFPGLPLAMVNPRMRFTLIDSSGKKIRFVAHAAHLLGLANVEALHARVEQLAPEAPFSTVVARAFAPLPQLLARVARVCGPATRVLAMKGRPAEEELAAVPSDWRIEALHTLNVPGLEAARTLVILRPA